MLPLQLLLPRLLFLFAVRSVDGANEIGRFGGAFVADGAPELLQRVRGGRAQKEIEPRMGRKRGGGILESGLVLGDMAGRTHVHPLHGGEAVVLAQVGQHLFLDLDARRNEVEHGSVAQGLEDPSGQKGDLVVDLGGSALKLLEPGFQGVPLARDPGQLLLGGLEDRFGLLRGDPCGLHAPGVFLKVLFQLLAVVRRGLVEQDPRPVPFRLGDLGVRGGPVLLAPGRVEFGFGLPEGFLRIELLLDRCDLLLELVPLLEVLGSLEAGRRGLRLLEFEPLKLFLEVLPRPVPVVDHHPDQRNEQQR